MQELRGYATTTAQLLAMAAWLRHWHVQRVVMESTSLTAIRTPPTLTGWLCLRPGQDLCGSELIVANSAFAANLLCANVITQGNEVGRQDEVDIPVLVAIR